MTAVQALASGVYDIVVREAHSSARTVRDVLDGYPARGRLQAALLRELAKIGVDVSTIPERTPEEVAAWKAKRQPGCANCKRLEARVAELEAAQAQSQPAPATTIVVPTPPVRLAVVAKPSTTPRRVHIVEVDAAGQPVEAVQG